MYAAADQDDGQTSVRNCAAYREPLNFMEYGISEDCPASWQHCLSYAPVVAVVARTRQGSVVAPIIHRFLPAAPLVPFFGADVLLRSQQLQEQSLITKT